MVPSAETPSATTGAVCPASTVSGALLPSAPDRDAAVGAAGHGAAVGEQRDRVHGVVVEAQHLSALLRVSDQRIAEESKLPESASLPSAETRARAPGRHGRAAARGRG